MSLLELLEIIGELDGQAPSVRFDDWRVGDQRYYVSDTRAFQSRLAGSPGSSVREGVAALHRWLIENNETAREALQRGVA